MERRWISIREASTYLGIHEKTAYSWATKGVLPSAKIGGCIRIDRKKLDELLERQSEDFCRKLEKLGNL